MKPFSECRYVAKTARRPDPRQTKPQALQGVQGRVHLPRVRVRSESGGRVGTHLLTGVEQRSAHLQVERVRLVERHCQRLPAAPDGQFAPAGSACSRTAPPTRPSRPAATPSFRGSSFAILDGGARTSISASGSECRRASVSPRPRLFVIVAGALEPVEQHRLAGAARPGQDDVMRRRRAAEEVGLASGQHCPARARAR